MIRAATEQNEKLGVGLGPKELVAHCEPNLGPLSTSPCTLEAGECSNTLLGPLSSTPNPDGLGDNPMVCPIGLVTPVEILRSDDDEGSLSVYQLQVVSPVRVMQTDDVGVLSNHQSCDPPVGVSGCTESPPTMVFNSSSDRNSILSSNMLSGGLISKGKRLVTRFCAAIGWTFSQSFSRVSASWVTGFWSIG